VRRRVILPAALLAALALGGCATTPRPSLSHVSGVSASDAALLANAMAQFLGQQLPRAATTLVLQPPSRDQASNALTPALHSALVQAGFGVQEAAPGTPLPNSGGYALRYLVSPLDAGVLVRLQYHQTEASRWYARNSSGQLQAASPFTVRVAP
jgi:hypothetical protein